MSQKEVKAECKFDVSVFKERFHDLRKGFKLSQAEFAAFLEIPTGSVGGYENGDKTPNSATLFKIAKKCNVSTDYLLGLQKEPVLNEDAKAVCKYTGLSEGAIKYLNEMNNEATNGSKAFEDYFQMNEEYKKGIILKIELLDFFLRSDEADFSIVLDSGAKYREEMKIWINRVNVFFDKVSTLDSVDEDKAKELFDIRTKLLEEEYKAVRYNYFEAVEFFKDSLNEYVKDLTETGEKLLFKLMCFSPFDLLKEGVNDGEHN